MAGREKLFRTADYGYYMPDVDATIVRYNDAIKKLQMIIAEQKDVINRQEREKEKCLNEIKRLHLEMSMMEVPEMGAGVEYLVLDNFKNRKNNSNIDDKNIENKELEENKNKKSLLESLENSSFHTSSESEFKIETKNDLNTDNTNDNDDDDDDVFKIIV